MNPNTLAFINSKIVTKPKTLVLTSYDVLIKIGKAPAWKRVSTLKQYDDGSFSIWAGYGWARFGKSATIEVYY